jgi:acetyl esterase/lipase
MATVEIDPEIAGFLAGIDFPAIGPDTVEAIRGAGLGPPPQLSDTVERTDHVVSSDPEVIVRVHRPKGFDGPLPCVYSIHGGGYVIGSRDMDDGKFDRWCPSLGIVGVSVEYRLAPETPYPGPLEDCYMGLQWTVEHAEEIGVDPSRIGVHGISAGGGLAAALALLARDRGEIALRFQLLDCPMIDDRQHTSSSQLDGLAIWSRDSNTFGWRSYLGGLYGTADIPYHAVPARADDLSGLPPTYICVGGADGFRDEDIEYALRLGRAGVPTELHVHPGAPHGVEMFVGTQIAARYSAPGTDWLRRQVVALSPNS